MDATINWQLNSDDLFRQMEQVNSRILQMTREMNTQQVTLMQEATSNMITVMDNYVQRIKTNFDSIMNMMKTTYELAKSENIRSFEEIRNELDKLNKFAKDSADDQLRSLVDSFNKKVDLEEKYVQRVKSSTDDVIQQRQKEANSEAELRQSTGAVRRTMSTVSGGISTATGGLETSYIDQSLGMVSKGVEGVLAGVSLDFDVMFSSFVSSVSSAIGMLMNVMKKNDLAKQELFNIYSMAGESPTGVYGGEFGVGDPSSTLFKMKQLEARYAGIRGFDVASMQQTMGQFGVTRMYETSDLYRMGEQATLLGKGTGLQGTEVAEIFNQLRLRLNTPIEDLAGRFVQLNELSKDMGLSLKQVTSDIMQLSVDNQRYGFSLEQVMSFYKEFEVEIKKGTVSVGQLSEYMRGLSETPTDKAVGIAALIASQDPEKVMANFTGNRALGQEIATLMKQAPALEGAQILRIVNSGADISQDPMLAPIAEKYGLTLDVRKRLNPEVERYVSAVSETIARQTNQPGATSLIYEQIMGTMNLPVPTELTARENFLKGMRTLGQVTDVTGLEEGKIRAGVMTTEVGKNLEQLTMFIERLNKTMEQNLQGIADKFIQEMKKPDPNISKLIEEVPKMTFKVYEPILKSMGFTQDEMKRGEENAKNIANIASNVAKIASGEIFSVPSISGKEKVSFTPFDIGPLPLMYKMYKILSR